MDRDRACNVRTMERQVDWTGIPSVLPAFLGLTPAAHQTEERPPVLKPFRQGQGKPYLKIAEEPAMRPKENVPPLEPIKRDARIVTSLVSRN